MYSLKLPQYRSLLSLRDTERAIKAVKDGFEQLFQAELGLERISAPMFVKAGTGINDDLNGVERPVTFDVLQMPSVGVEIVQSLAKWKRIALKNYGFMVGEGLYTDMNAVRRDDAMDNIHSVYVDQWDWEMVIDQSMRNPNYLRSIVRRIVNVIADAEAQVCARFSRLKPTVCRDVAFITADELRALYPDYSPKQRENVFVRQHRTAFIMQIGGAMTDGTRHDGRAPDYDDWMLNGDLLFWNDLLGEALEISSMGIRVDADALRRQLEISNQQQRSAFAYHRAVLDGELPLTIGGGIGQSRLCMLLLKKLHIGEVQVSVWPEQMLAECAKAGLRIL